MPAFKKLNKGIQVTKCTEEFIQKMCNILRAGAYPETAAVMAGAEKKTFLDWMRWSHPEIRDGVRNKKYKPIYASLRYAVEKAIEEATCRDLMNIDKCAMGIDVEYMRDEKGGIVFAKNGNPIILKLGLNPDWKASAWRLERRFSKQWARTEKVEHSGPEGAPIETSIEPSQEREKRIEDKIERLKKLFQG